MGVVPAAPTDTFKETDGWKTAQPSDPLLCGRAVRVVQRAERGEVGRLRIGFIDAITTGFLANVLAHFRKERPDVEIELLELASLKQA